MRRFPAKLLALGLFVSLGSAHAASFSVGVETNNEPISFVQSNGRPAGFAVDIVDAIAKEMNLQVTVVAGPWDDIFTRFKDGQIDALGSLAYRKERDEFIDFSVVDLSLKGSVFVRKGNSHIRKFDDLRTARLAVPPRGFTQEYLTSIGLGENFVFVPSLAEALKALEEGQCDALAATGLIAENFMREHGLKNVEKSPIELPGFSYEFHLGVRAGDSDRLALINQGLANLHANGTYDRLYEKWIGPLKPRSLRFEDIQPYLAPAILMLIVITGTLVWQRRLLLRLALQTEALRQSEEQLTLVLEGSEAGFWDWDLQTGKVERSERWAFMLGYVLSEIPPTLDVGVNLLHPDDLSAYDAFKRKLTSGDGNRYDVAYRVKTKSGDWRWILDRGKVVARAADGSPQRVAGTYTDITDLKLAQEELARQEAQFRFIYEQTPVGLSWLRWQKSEKRHVNAAHERITGVSAAEAQETQNYINATHPDDRERQRLLQERLDRGEIDHYSIEKRYVHPSGKVAWAMLNQHRYVDPVTKETQTVTTLVDIDQIKRAEEERSKLHLKLVETQKLESLGVLAGGIAHDFNNLLTVILANANLARLDSSDQASHDESLAQIETAASRAADLCRQMLAYAGKASFLVERIDMVRLVQDTTHLLKISISKKANLILSLASDLPHVEADRSQLQQVVMNLVINASEALGDNAGEIRLTASIGRPSVAPGGVIHSFDLPEGKCACLEVADTGQGMDAATLVRIFDPFFTTKFAGRGLGLAAVLGIVRACRGALTVESTPGKGTKFRLYLPAAAPAATPAPKATPTPQPATAGRGSILVADDEPAVLATVNTLLQRQGYQTVLATDGDEAIRQFRANPHAFTALLLDLTMPGLDGAQVLREVRSLHPTARVLIMSGFGEQDVLDRLAGLGPVTILHKPFTHADLLTRLNNVIAS